MREQETTSEKYPASRIPVFQTVEEEAAFWDSHDSTEFENEFEAVTDVQFTKVRPTKAITVRLERDSFAALSERARERGFGPAALARLWILEHLSG
jgi:hypothetical protein